jgi:hypothetical protein
MDIISVDSVRDNVSDADNEVCVQLDDKIVICGTPMHLHDLAHKQHAMNKLSELLYG